MPAPNSPPRNFRYISKKRRTKEDRRFITGAGHFVADISLPGMLHVALVASPHAFARIVSIDTHGARALEGVKAVLTGEELARASDPMMSGLDLPKLRRYPLAPDLTRMSGNGSPLSSRSLAILPKTPRN